MSTKTYMEALQDIQHNIEFAMRRLMSLKDNSLATDQKFRLTGLAFIQCNSLEEIDKIIKEVHRQGIGDHCCRCTKPLKIGMNFCGQCELELIKLNEDEN